jgi:hypothetical protein
MVWRMPHPIPENPVPDELWHPKTTPLRHKEASLGPEVTCGNGARRVKPQLGAILGDGAEVGCNVVLMRVCRTLAGTVFRTLQHS